MQKYSNMVRAPRHPPTPSSIWMLLSQQQGFISTQAHTQTHIGDTWQDFWPANDQSSAGANWPALPLTSNSVRNNWPFNAFKCEPGNTLTMATLSAQLHIKCIRVARCKFKPVGSNASAFEICQAFFFPPPYVIQSQKAIHHRRRRVTHANLIIVLDNAITHGSFYLCWL